MNCITCSLNMLPVKMLYVTITNSIIFFLSFMVLPTNKTIDNINKMKFSIYENNILNLQNGYTVISIYTDAFRSVLTLECIFVCVVIFGCFSVNERQKRIYKNEFLFKNTIV